jgi:hypothetical protein
VSSTQADLLAATQADAYTQNSSSSSSASALLALTSPPNDASLVTGLTGDSDAAAPPKTLFTMCQSLDHLLVHAGVPLGAITELAGVPGVGKTQLGLQLALNAVLPPSVGGVCGRAVVIDCEGGVSARRVHEMAVHLANLCRETSGQPAVCFDELYYKLADTGVLCEFTIEQDASASASTDDNAGDGDGAGVIIHREVVFEPPGDELSVPVSPRSLMQRVMLARTFTPAQLLGTLRAVVAETLAANERWKARLRSRGRRGGRRGIYGEVLARDTKNTDDDVEEEAEDGDAAYEDDERILCVVVDSIAFPLRAEGAQDRGFAGIISDISKVRYFQNFFLIL